MSANENSPRAERAQLIAAKRGAVKRVKDGSFAVKSQSGVGQYRVERAGEAWTCTCHDHIKRGGECKHVLATKYWLEARTTAPDGSQRTERIRLTSPQAWKAYNAAQTAEVRLFDELLRDLVNGIEDHEQRMGRPRTPLRDATFCAIQKVYSQLSVVGGSV